MGFGLPELTLPDSSSISSQSSRVSACSGQARTPSRVACSMSGLTTCGLRVQYPESSSIGKTSGAVAWHCACPTHRATSKETFTTDPLCFDLILQYDTQEVDVSARLVRSVRNQATSITSAAPIPPPAHIDNTPIPPPRRPSSWTADVTIRAPVAATG